jgi:16S rRNA (cytosine1402-N4)-methyltransferase
MMKNAYHIAVMQQQAVSLLLTNKSGIYVDATLGAGGHTLEMLGALHADATVYGIDQDNEAIREASENIGNDSRFKTIRGNFGHLETILPQEIIGNVDGILLDLGVSSHQIDEASRGFSFQQDGPLDMRMGTLRQLTAEQVVNTYPYERLRNILYQYGEELKSGLIAKTIIENRPLSTTGDLKRCVEKVVKGKFQVKSLARVFQAIRIEVNQELDVLERVLEQSVNILKEGGRIVVISYHSLEDRLVKNYLKAGNFKGDIQKDFYGNNIRPFQPLTNKVITATEDEIRANSRSRSARMRVAERIEEGYVN